MRILVVEDELQIQDFLKKSLEAECHAVDTAANGADGVTLGKLNHYDLIILDNLMPQKTGLEACQELRTEGVQTPILLLSVQSAIDTKVQALNAGADDYLTKPFSLDELLARTRALLRRPLNITAEVLVHEDLHLDTQKHIVRKADEEILLTKKEFMLLRYFMQNPTIVLSRGMIMEHVWDMNADPFSNTIETHVASLRRKIHDGSHTKYIQTISGRGYRFGAPTYRADSLNL